MEVRILLPQPATGSDLMWQKVSEFPPPRSRPLVLLAADASAANVMFPGRSAGGEEVWLDLDGDQVSVTPDCYWCFMPSEMAAKATLHLPDDPGDEPIGTS
jgi:hypothetical protein